MSISYVVIDGNTYNVPVIELSRDAEFLYKYAERTVDGVLHSELIGVYFNYKLSFGRATPTAYNQLWLKLTEPREFHTIKVPSSVGFHTYEAYFSNVKDTLKHIQDSDYYWRGLTVNFIAKEPARV